MDAWVGSKACAMVQGAVLALPAPETGANGAPPELEDTEPPEKRQRLEPAPSGLGDADEDDEVRSFNDALQAESEVQSTVVGPSLWAQRRCPSSTVRRRGGEGWRPRAHRALSCAPWTAFLALDPSVVWPRARPLKAALGTRLASRRPTAFMPMAAAARAARRSWWRPWAPGGRGRSRCCAAHWSLKLSRRCPCQARSCAGQRVTCSSACAQGMRRDRRATLPAPVRHKWLGFRKCSRQRRQP